MLPDEPYNEEVRRRFLAPEHVDVREEAPAETVAATASESRLGARTRLAIVADEGTIVSCRHATWGCPHLIAAAELVCEQLESTPVGELAQFQPNEIMRRLSVPVQKTGRILLLEDAVQSLAAKLETMRRQ